MPGSVVGRLVDTDRYIRDTTCQDHSGPEPILYLAASVVDPDPLVRVLDPDPSIIKQK